MENKTLDVYKETARILRKLDATRDIPATRALLANIRNSINKETSSNMDALTYVFQNIPEEFIGSRNELNDYEKSIFTALQMYALHQQANMNSVLKLDYEKDERRQNMGDALSYLRTNDSKSTDARFNALVTSSNFKQLENHLRQMVKLLKAKSEVKVDYASLADDLYWFLKKEKDGIKIKWARAYYKFRKENEKGED
ncbi:type I-E CRISPR-associated protein Cse2/CasB [Peptoniphilus sp. GNH]|nr:CRISPR system CASCADE complex protein CasB [Clostridiales bacterium KA00134]UHR03315.1 type I-E CRISPR-associated protein Cse2/CasB [Peptoniphilus sp. GNH]